MHGPDVRDHARQLYLAGATVAEAARAVGLPYRTFWHWCRDRPEPVQQSTALRCFRCRQQAAAPVDPAAYAYLLGLYLGDGHLVTSARVPFLRIFCANAWPNLIDACEQAMLAVLANPCSACR